MKVHLKIELPCSFEQAVDHVKTPRLLHFVANPLVRFAPTDKTVVPPVWEESVYWFKLRLFGVIPFGKQAVRITFHEGKDVFKVRDNGDSALIKKWDHWITIRRNGVHATYSDSLDLDAGVLTPFVWVFAQAFYRHRQRRWLRLARANFDYDGA